jgi:GntR family transcriptional repressor for pyruvate dehydrogenase complex
VERARPESKRTVRRRKVSAVGFSKVVATGGSLVDEVADHIRARLDEGVVGIGERLPSERDLVQELGISRAVLRESLSSLESLGYLEARTGQGRFVADPESGSSQRLIDDWLRRHQAELRDLIELRAAIESQALRGATADLATMASAAIELLAAQAHAIEDGRLDDAAESDMAFHLGLASGTENRPLRLLAEALIGRARQAAHAAYRVSAYRRASLRQHRAIVAALKAGDRDRAADLLMEHHLSRVDQLASYLERPPDGSRPPNAAGASSSADGRQRRPRVS